MLIDNPWFYVAAVPAVMLTGISKGGFGGAGGVAVPMMALLISPVQAAAIMLPILCLMDAASLVAYRKLWHRRNTVILIVAGLVGTVIGWITFDYLTDDFVRLIVGVIALSFTLYRWIVAPLLGRRDMPASEAHAGRGAFWGTLMGFTSFVAHAGSPPAQIFLLPQKLDKTLYQGTMVVVFMVLNYVKLVPYAMLGQLSAANMTTALVLLPLAPLGVWLGVWLHKRVPELLFYRIAYVLLFGTGLKLVWDGLSNTLG
ncbi:MAG: sulfite exporter TauE/SafE family protein [Alphaproteobacteria bacterium]|nr:sulfite exporter TauE/SafE family protein [Alphaproteobacteria bacterium]